MTLTDRDSVRDRDRDRDVSTVVVFDRVSDRESVNDVVLDIKHDKGTRTLIGCLQRPTRPDFAVSTGATDNTPAVLKPATGSSNSAID